MFFCFNFFKHLEVKKFKTNLYKCLKQNFVEKYNKSTLNNKQFHFNKYRKQDSLIQLSQNFRAVTYATIIS